METNAGKLGPTAPVFPARKINRPIIRIMNGEKRRGNDRRCLLPGHCDRDHSLTYHNRPQKMARHPENTARRCKQQCQPCRRTPCSTHALFKCACRLVCSLKITPLFDAQGHVLRHTQTRHTMHPGKTHAHGKQAKKSTRNCYAYYASFLRSESSSVCACASEA